MAQPSLPWEKPGLIDDFPAVNRVLEEGGGSAAGRLKASLQALQEEFQVAINLHDLAGISQIDPQIQSVLEPHLYHNNPFCNAVKKTPGGLAVCSLGKDLLCRRFQSPAKPFYGQCYLGVEELRYPIRWNGKLLGLLCVGLFCSDRSRADLRIDHYAPRIGAESGPLKALHRAATRGLDLDVRRFGHRIGFLADYLALLYARFFLARQQGIGQEEDALEHTRHYLVTRTKAFIQGHYASDLPLRILAANVYCSESYLSALFRRVEGTTLTAYILGVRIAKAQALLDTTTKTATEVAFLTGFHDSNYFTRAFGRLVGLSPGRYRARNPKALS